MKKICKHIIPLTKEAEEAFKGKRRCFNTKCNMCKVELTELNRNHIDCIVEGCFKDTKAHGLCSTHYAYYMDHKKYTHKSFKPLKFKEGRTI